MSYRIVNTTDRQHLGKVLLELPLTGSELKLGDSFFEIISIKRIGGIIKIISYNYIVEVVGV